ncbi:hypothetical protein ACWEFL_18905 [Streptomyces sp. NPDC004838]
MTAQDKGNPLETEEFACSVELGPGWLDLTLDTGTRAEAEALAARIVKQAGARTMTIKPKALFEDIVARSVDLNADEPVMVAVCYAETGEALTELVIDSYRDENGPRPGREQMGELLLEWAGADPNKGTDVTYPDLPAGSAVRVRTLVRTKQMLGLWREASGSVRYAVSVPGIRSVIVATATWQNLERSDEIAWLVDQLMPTLRVELIGADGGLPAG